MNILINVKTEQHTAIYVLRGKYPWRTWFIALVGFQQTSCLIAMVKILERHQSPVKEFLI